MTRSVLVEYVVQIVAPEGYPSNAVMDEALHTVSATMDYNDNLEKWIEDRFVRGVDSLGEAGFSVRVVRKR